MNDGPENTFWRLAQPPNQRSCKYKKSGVLFSLTPTSSEARFVPSTLFIPEGSEFQCSCLVNPMDRGSWWAVSSWGLNESDLTEATEQGSTLYFWYTFAHWNWVNPGLPTPNTPRPQVFKRNGLPSSELRVKTGHHTGGLVLRLSAVSTPGLHQGGIQTDQRAWR